MQAAEVKAAADLISEAPRSCHAESSAEYAGEDVIVWGTTNLKVQGRGFEQLPLLFCLAWQRRKAAW
jgi:hypothetical protein